ncbi:TPA: type II secretion system F family protein [Candidatus Woesearchaeota archaeon]|nr:MAG: Type II secretion system protein F [archaeon GW2011_AR11]MBS3111295.1 type II secretion system F family protein [Candidatus Woesearchaeota archaeon]HIH05072.1 type II secretion system F family protein [Candidatus Woesearchaeota archaeon]HIH91463.1 type II secretion system F family protein [Candidatus Woesearchaeota archaeon]HII64629.1 type II secretion system F family protein [Candidatus Woesearchaeota archaeon]
MGSIAKILFARIADSVPHLRFKLKQAGMNIKPEDFVKQTFLSAFYLTAGLFSSITLILVKFEAFTTLLLLLVFPFFALLMFYLIKIPDAKILGRGKDISKEVVFAGRFLIIELESGVPLYNALQNLSKNYKAIGSYVKEITDKVDLGTSMEDALNEAVELVPSDDLRKMFWQIINSLRTGSDVSRSLLSTVDQIAKRQKIQINEYSKKLNPLAMFYMMIAVIAPSLGMTMLIILSSFVNFTLSLTILLFLAALLGFMQFMFLATIKFSRPPIDL